MEKNKFRWEFQTHLDGKTKGVIIEGTSYYQALGEAKDKLGVSIHDMEEIRTERLEDNKWVVIFDPYIGLF